MMKHARSDTNKLTPFRKNRRALIFVCAMHNMLGLIGILGDQIVCVQNKLAIEFQRDKLLYASNYRPTRTDPT